MSSDTSHQEKDQDTRNKPINAHFNTHTFNTRFVITATPLHDEKSRTTKRLISKPLVRPHIGHTTTTIRANMYGTTNQSKIRFQHNFDICDSWITSHSHDYNGTTVPSSWDSIREMQPDEVAQAATQYIQRLVSHIGEHRVNPTDEIGRAHV